MRNYKKMLNLELKENNFHSYKSEIEDNENAIHVNIAEEESLYIYNSSIYNFAYTYNNYFIIYRH